MKIVILDAQALNPGDLSYGCLNQFGEVTEYPRTETEEETIRRIGDSEIVLVNKVPITERILTACPNIRLICVQATGYNIVDCQAARQHGVTVCNVPAYSTDSVAQLTLALMLEHCHHIGHHSAAVHDGKWCRSINFCFWETPLIELAGKTLGIIGFGSIGKAVAKLARAFGMEVIAFSRSQNEEGRALAEYVSLDELLGRSDFVSLHCPLFPETEKLINAGTITKMKDGAVLINTSRGGVIDEQAVADALHSGKLACAAVDVVTQEPMREDNPLLGAPNCIITPHIAWAPREARLRLFACVEENIRRFLQGNPQNVVN